MIEDEELRDLYQISSQEHLAKLEAGLLELEKNQDNPQLWAELLREAHSLKGDSGMLGLERVEALTHKLEDLCGQLQRQEIKLDGSLSDRLYQSFDTLRLLVEEAVTGVDSGVDVAASLAQLEGKISAFPMVKQVEEEVIADITLPPTAKKISSVGQIIEDEELRVAFQESTQEHLEKLTQGLEELAKLPFNKTLLAELTIAAENIKSDALILELEEIQLLAEAVEDLLQALLEEKIKITPVLVQHLQTTREAISALIHTAITGKPHNVNAEEILAYLMAEELETATTQNSPIVVTEKPSAQMVVEKNITQLTNELSESTETINVITQPLDDEETPRLTPGSSETEELSPPFSENNRIDTIRVQTRYLDALMTQSGELTVTKIRIAHLASEIETLTNLWEEWKLSKHQEKYLPRENSKIFDYEEQIEKKLKKLKTNADEHSARLEVIAGDLEEKITTLRLLPLSTILQIFPRMVRDLARQQRKQVKLIIEGADTGADKHILEEIKDPLMHIIRNAVDHGIDTPAERQKQGKPPGGTIKIRGYQSNNNLIIEVSDDGRGLDTEKIKQTAIKRGLYHREELEGMSTNQIYALILAPGFSTRNIITEVSGRGVGLDVLQTTVEKLKGHLEITSTPGQGSTFRIQLSTTLATANVLLVNVQKVTYALPIEFVLTTLLVSSGDIFTIEGKETIFLENQAVSLVELAYLLEIPQKNFPNHQQQKTQERTCVLMQVGKEKFGLFVDQLLDTQDVVVKPQSKLLKRVRNIAGATILGTGEVCMILNPQDLLNTLQKGTKVFISSKIKEKVPTKPAILLVEDSISIRTQEKRILETAGYEVVTAVDGLDGYHKLKSRHFDAVVSDVQMPNLDGLSLTAKIRQESQYAELPIILVTSLASDEDKKRGAEAGANAYITKGEFNQNLLLETLIRMV